MSNPIGDHIFEEAVQAIINGHADRLIRLIDDHPDLPKERFTASKGEPTLLHFVAANGVDDKYQRTPTNAVDIAQILFDAGADPRETATFYGGGSGSTALVGLLSSVHPYEAGLQEKLIEVFIRSGAPVDGILGDGMPLATALAFWYPSAAKKLMSLGADLQNIVFAAAAGDVGKLEQMVDSDRPEQRYPDPFNRELNIEKERNTAFVKACLCDQLSSIDFLLHRGFDVNGTTINGQSGLHEAAYRGSVETVKYLINKGADQFRDAQFNGFPIHWAKAGKQENIFNYLLDITDLALADYAEFGLLDQVREIIKKEPGRINEKNGLPLQTAVSAKQIEVIHFLVEQGADPYLKDANGTSAVDIAAKTKQEEILQKLKKHH